MKPGDLSDLFLQAYRNTYPIDLSGDEQETINRLFGLVGTRIVGADGDFIVKWKPLYQAAGEPYGADVRGLLRWFDEESERSAE